jgi:formylglycine-generating enzyme required for sulfatase activity
VKLIPWDDHPEATRLACRLRNQELARRALDSARQQYDQLRHQQIDTLRRERGELESGLRGRQLTDFLTVLQGFFDRVNPTDAFPVEEWLGFAERLQPRRYRLSPLELLEKAEDAWEEWRQRRVVTVAPKVVTVAPKALTNSIGMKLALIPAGAFVMGSPDGESGRDADEGPQHEVAISRAFYLGVFPVTQEQWQRLMGNSPSYFGCTTPESVVVASWQRLMGNSPSYFCPGGGGKDKVKGLDIRNFPVEQVSYEDAVKFCEKLSELPEEKRAKRLYRLPTEAEWEYACRGGAASYPVFHFGNSLSSTQANFDGNHPYGGARKGPYLGRTSEVGAYKVSNGFGLHDLHGNVWEWCADWYAEDYYAGSPRLDPPGPSEGSARVIRGGSWGNSGQRCRSAERGRNAPGYRSYILGFRVALVLSGQAK